MTTRQLPPGRFALEVKDVTRVGEGAMWAYWMKLWLDWTMLAVDAQTVIGLRLMMLGAGGTAAQTEIDRMVTEKASALVEATAILVSGGSAHKVIAGYRKHVRANSRRLRKSSR
jgi:hypothetical protein